MRYLGGKKRLAKHIAAVLESHRSDGQRFVDVFCGSLAVTAAMSDRGPRLANDGCVPLIRLYEAWRQGWRPPVITEELYQAVKATQDPTDPLTAFVGFGCSYGGKWFGGYARGDHRDYAAEAARSIARFLTADVSLSCCPFTELDVRETDLVYADPEYNGTTNYNYFARFDYAAFIVIAQAWADRGASVFVSEYASQAPTWDLVAEWTTTKSIAKSTCVERLYRVRPT